jgi:iron complex outermembrane receptor protein
LSVLAPQQLAPRFSAWNFSRMSPSYRLTGDVRAYATHAKTFKSGGINPNGVPADASAWQPAAGRRHGEAGIGVSR